MQASDLDREPPRKANRRPGGGAGSGAAGQPALRNAGVGDGRDELPTKWGCFRRK